jgi:hypothetical protein
LVLPMNLADAALIGECYCFHSRSQGKIRCVVRPLYIITGVGTANEFGRI